MVIMLVSVPGTLQDNGIVRRVNTVSANVLI